MNFTENILAQTLKITPPRSPLFGLDVHAMSKFVSSFAFLLVGISPVLAGETSVSPNGDLTYTHTHEDGCSTGRISGTYRVKGGVSGLLYEIDCKQEGDIAFFFFVDTEGSERCYGKMTETWGGREGMTTRWQVLGNAPGYSCSTVGQLFTVTGMR